MSRRRVVAAAPSWMDREAPEQRGLREHRETMRRRRAEYSGRPYVPFHIEHPEAVPNGGMRWQLSEREREVNAAEHPPTATLLRPDDPAELYIGTPPRPRRSNAQEAVA